jgi:hypothetical protein
MFHKQIRAIGGPLPSSTERLASQHGALDIIEVDQAMIEECEKTSPAFGTTARAIFEQKGRRALAYKERYLLDLLGASLYDAAVRRRTSTVERTKHGRYVRNIVDFSCMRVQDTISKLIDFTRLRSISSPSSCCRPIVLLALK